MGVSDPFPGAEGRGGCFRLLNRRKAFTLLEILASMAVFSLMLVMIFAIVSQTSSVWRNATKNLASFQGARQAFDILTRTISQATLNGYWDYQFTAGQPARYRRNSDLHFLVVPAGQDSMPGTPGCGQAVFFQALLGKNGAGGAGSGGSQLLNEVGFYVEFGSDRDRLPGLLRDRLTEKFRYRLYQTIEPSETLDIYAGSEGAAWVNASNAQPIADNVIALVLVPRRAAAEEAVRGPLVSEMSYDSRLDAEARPQPTTAHQLPPFLEVYLVAIDEASAVRVEAGEAQPTLIRQALTGKFQTLDRLSQDLDDLIVELAAGNVQARIFSTSMVMRESKWSEF